MFVSSLYKLGCGVQCAEGVPAVGVMGGGVVVGTGKELDTSPHKYEHTMM